MFYAHDRNSGLRAIIAIHSRRRGPAIGGCRMLDYPDDASALTDVLRLSKGMTYKCAISAIPFGGGKAVIIGHPTKDKSTQLLHAMGDAVEQLGGSYITSFDSGTTLDDIATIGERTRHVGGIKPGAGNASQSTAYGIYVCMREAAKIQLESDTLEGLRIAIQGAGNVGARLASLAAKDGADIMIADVRSDLAAQVAATTGAQVVPAEAICNFDCDILAPCALGGILSMESVAGLNCAIICGGANNQLATRAVAAELAARQILYCPDYLVNAGGIVDLHYQLNESSRDALPQHLDGLATTLRHCYDQASASGCDMATAANYVAEARLK